MALRTRCILRLTATLLAVFPATSPAGDPWPLDRDGIALAFSTALTSILVSDSQGQPVLGWKFAPKGCARLNRHGALRLGHGGFIAEGPDAGLGQRLTTADGLTVLAWIQPDSSPGDGVILALDDTTGTLALRLSAEEKGLRLAFAGASTPAARPQSPEPSGVAVAATVSRDHVALYLSGELRAEQPLTGAEWTWRAPRLSLGTPDPSRDAGWQGTVEGIVLYDRVLPAEEIARAGARYAELAAARPAAPQLKVRARLTGKSTILSPRDLAPYTRGLCVYAYDVLRVIEGTCDAQVLQVAHWMVLDETLLPFSDAPIGVEFDLTLERLEDNPQLAEENLSDDIVEDFSLPFYYDAGGLSVVYTAPSG